MVTAAPDPDRQGAVPSCGRVEGPFRRPPTLVSLASEDGRPATPVLAKVAAELCAWFGDTALAKDVQRLLEAGARVPQEALGRPALDKLQS